MNLAHLLERMAHQAPERLAIFNGTQCVATYWNGPSGRPAWARS